MSEENASDVRRIAEYILENLLQSHGIRLTEEAKTREIDGLYNAIRAIIYLALLDINRHRSERFWYDLQEIRNINLSGQWDALSPSTIGHAELLMRRHAELKADVTDKRLAQRLESKYKMSKLIRSALADEKAEEAIANLAIAMESAFLKELKARHNQQKQDIKMEEEEEEISEEEIESLENEKGKWFG